MLPSPVVRPSATDAPSQPHQHGPPAAEHLQERNLRQVSASASPAACPAACSHRQLLRQRLIAELEEDALVGQLAAAVLAPAVVGLGHRSGRERGIGRQVRGGGRAQGQRSAAVTCCQRQQHKAAVG